MRIFISGPGGGGKSTLARAISSRWNIPLQSLDDIHWIRDPAGDRRRPMDDKLAMLAEVVVRDTWVIEGVQFKWADMALERADHIIVLDTPFLRNQFQIIKRFVRQVRGTEKADYKPTLATLMRIFRWSADYRRYERAMLLTKLEPFGDKAHVVRTMPEALAILENVDAPSGALQLRGV